MISTVGKTGALLTGTSVENFILFVKCIKLTNVSVYSSEEGEFHLNFNSANMVKTLIASNETY